MNLYFLFFSLFHLIYFTPMFFRSSVYLVSFFFSIFDSIFLSLFYSNFWHHNNILSGFIERYLLLFDKLSKHRRGLKSSKRSIIHRLCFVFVHCLLMYLGMYHLYSLATLPWITRQFPHGPFNLNCHNDATTCNTIISWFPLTLSFPLYAIRWYSSTSTVFPHN